MATTAADPSAPAQQASVTPTVTPVDVSDLGDPNALVGTRFTGPVLCGAPSTIKGVIMPAGACLVTQRVYVTYQNGTFSLPVQLPAGSILLQTFAQVATVFTGTTPKFNIGIVQNGSSIASIDLTVAGQTATPVTVVLASPWQIWFSLAVVGTMTAGAATVILQYSIPGKPMPS